MATRKKSLDDLINQTLRIRNAINRRWVQDPSQAAVLDARDKRIKDAYKRYAANIAKQSGYRNVASQGENASIEDIAKINTKKYSRSTYMGVG